MMEIELPERLWALRDELVTRVEAHGPQLADCPHMQAWLEEEGLQAMLDSWGDEVAINLDAFDFSDDRLREYEALEPDEEITDDQRVEYARGQIAARIEDDTDYMAPNVHLVQLTRADGHKAIIGYTSQNWAQEGVLIWQGVFPDKDAFLSHLRSQNLWYVGPGRDVETFDHETLLRFWRKNEGNAVSQRG